MGCEPENASAPPKLMIADRYRVTCLLGRGGMGAVYEVEDATSGKRLALKQLAPASGASAAALFEREYHTLAGLKHRAIVEVYEYGGDHDGAFYTMELIEGVDLSKAAPMPWREACRHLRDVASSLGLLHARQLVHRDLILGRRLGLVVALVIAGISLHRQRHRAPPLKGVVMQLMAAVAALAGTAVTCLNGALAERYAEVIQPFTVLGEDHAALGRGCSSARARSRAQGTAGRARAIECGRGLPVSWPALRVRRWRILAVPRLRPSSWHGPSGACWTRPWTSRPR